MKEKIRQFMVGRYGMDQLGRFTMGVGVVALILQIFIRSAIFYYITVLCLVIYYFRAFSRNVNQRYQENLKYLRLRDRLLGRFTGVRSRMEQRKVYRFYTCPSCRKKLRVPRGHGKISITCPRCRHEFIRRT